MKQTPPIIRRAAVVAALVVITAATGWSQTQPSAPDVPAARTLRVLTGSSAVHKPRTQSIPTAPTGFAIVGSATVGGGRFFDLGGDAEAWLANAAEGIQAFGDNGGGHFACSMGSGVADVAYGDFGIAAVGNNAGGVFSTGNASGTAYLAKGDVGISATGNTMGAHFSGNHSGYANIGVGDYGIMAWGNAMPGYFISTSTSAYAYVGYNTSKITGSGSVGFVQNHPSDAGSVIVYNAPEGDEVATYTRGTARLANGEAHVALGETFKWVTNPDIGLTAHLTPHGEAVPLAIVSLSTSELVVRGPADAPDGLVFDYLVYGLRIGFEQTAVVQEKKQESFIPSMKEHRDLLARRPDLVRYTALARYTSERDSLGIKQPVDLKASAELKAAVHEFNPAVDKLDPAALSNDPLRAAAVSRRIAATRTAVTAAAQQQPVAEMPGSGTALPPIGSDEDVQARSFSSPREQLAARVPVAGTVEPGDVLVVDRNHPELFTRGERSADPTVVGIVVADAGIALGTRPAVGRGAQVALSGIAKCKVDARFGAIAPGDLLVTSPTAGYAMRDESPLPGTVVGKALEPLAVGQGVIRILVMLR